MKKRYELTTLKQRNGKQVVGYREILVDTPKNRSYVEKRKQIAAEVSAELGVSCWG